MPLTLEFLPQLSIGSRSRFVEIPSFQTAREQWLNRMPIGGTLTDYACTHLQATPELFASLDGASEARKNTMTYLLQFAFSSSLGIDQ